MGTVTDADPGGRQSGARSAAAEVGLRLRSIRAARGWTLDTLAARSGVSRRMIVNIEQGTANAGIGTLLRLGSAFGIALSELVQGLEAGGPPGWQVHRADDRTTLWAGDNGGHAVMVASATVPDMVELWDWTLGPGDHHESQAHAPGTRELVHVLSGRVRVSLLAGSRAPGWGRTVDDDPAGGPGPTAPGAAGAPGPAGESVVLAAGDALTLPGDRPHGYSNPGRSMARFALTVYEPVRRAR